ncbi:TonB-dependent siderophore receptor [Balneolaceae bacterium YR4-1]|uniref:TonB-dependent siderophore receptor n=1 Tax=Halalkalibaculum roseum TaxID=2709311 RepID=A0A6M1SW19_9BACT|nr:TonB-dependent siderophore receptor [Halalkalibaculum roseum]NGP77102.1 TonB-dependent siderophore receptor [Halalkalibaculum roseum]
MNSRKLSCFTFLLSAMFFFLFIPIESFAQTGKISGTVFDANSNSALTGVNVGLIDTRIGDATNDNGEFSISNVPEGFYTIRVSFVGYKTVEQNIQVQSDQTTKLEVLLSQKSVELGNISVTGRRSGYMISEISSVTKIGVPLLETPQSVSVITGQQLENQNIQDLGEALRYSSGVQGETFGFEPRTTFVRFRGFDATTSGLFRDGLQLRNPNFAVGYNPEPYGAERIEVPKGPASVLYGAGSPGGLVNFVSKKPTQVPFGEILLETGSFNRVQGQTDISGPLDAEGNFAYRFIGLFRNSDTQVDYINNDRFFLAPSFTWQPTNQTSLTILGRYQTDDSRASQRYPEDGTLDSNPNGTIPVDLFTGEPEVDQYDRLQRSIGYQFQHASGDWTFRQNLRYYAIDLDDVTIFGSALRADNRTLDRLIFESFGELDGLTIDNQVQLNTDTGPVTHKILVGFDYQNVSVKSEQNFGAAPPLDLYDPNYGSAVPDPSSFVNNDITQRQTGIYLQDQLSIDEKLILTLNGRYDWAFTETFNNLAESESSQDDQAFSGRIGLIYKTNFGLAPYVSYSESFSPAIGTDQSGVEFDPETGQQYEVGIKYEPAGSSSYITVALYDLTRQNFLQTDPATFAQVQTGEANSQGIEVEGVAGFNFGLNLTASFTYQDVEITESIVPEQVGDRPTQVRETMASLWADYAVQRGSLEGFGISAGVRHLGPMYGDLPNTLKIPSVTLADAAIFYDWSNFRLQVNVDNVFNDKYVASGFASGPQNFGTYGAVRSMQASIRYRW